MKDKQNDISQYKDDSWLGGNPYERFMGRWSTLVAREFLDWLAIPPGRSWLDVGCGTGTLTRQILESYQPSEITSVDSSSELISYAQQSIAESNVRFVVGLAQSLEPDSNSIDTVVSGLVLNFIPQPETAVSEMLRVAKQGGIIGIYLWDYADGMAMLRYFWDAAVALDDAAKDLDEGIRFPLCREGKLESLARASGMKQVEARPIVISTVFQDFDDYWMPFLGNVGPAPSYVTSLGKADRQRLEERLRGLLPIDDSGSISLVARAWAVKGKA